MKNVLLNKKGSVLSAAFLLSGYTIGTGFLAIPSASGPSGFWTGAFSGFLIWLFLICTGLLFLEALLTQPKGISIISLCMNLSGPFITVLASAAFCLINYYFSASIFDTSVSILQYFSLSQFNSFVPGPYLYLGLFAFFFATIFMGTYVSDRVNYLLYIFLIVSAIGAFIEGAKGITYPMHSEKNWYLIFFAVPLLVTSYDYQSLLPTLVTYLEKDVKKVLSVMGIGLVIPLILYTYWQWFVIKSSTSAQLWEAFEIGNLNVESFLRALHESLGFRRFFHSLTFFAAVTSLIGSGLALFDFFSDAFKIKLENRRGLNRFLICLLVFIPPLLAGWAFPGLFVSFPSYFVGFAEAFFLGILPIWLVVRIRHILRMQSIRLVPGGKITLTILSCATFFLIYFEGLQFFRKM